MKYSRDFFSGQRGGSLESARAIVPILNELCDGPKSVLDIGCGTGTWLSVFRDQGVEDVHGYDGDYVPRDMLLIPEERFHSADLSQPLKPDRRFDLAICLEVGEHLPEAAASDLVASLCAAAPLVAFSAAIPLQGGTGHINEQWQSYWRELFNRHNYTAIDAVRPRVWRREDVAFWYAQNLVLYASDEAVKNDQRLKELAAGTDDDIFDIVHPALLHMRNSTPLMPPVKLIIWSLKLMRRKLKSK